MSTTAPNPSPTLDVSATPPVPLSRLVLVEMRKMGDTRAGFWLLAAVLGVAALVILGFFLWGDSDARSFLDLMLYAGGPFGFLLPVLGILLVTQEWGQRTALVTFTQVPHRSHVVVAKVLAATILTFAALAFAAVVALPLSLVGGADEPFADVGAGTLLRVILGVLVGTLWGVAFGMAFLNSALAIVLYFVAPTVISIVTEIWTAAREQLLWFDLNASSTALFEFTEPMTGEQWAQLLTGFLLWVVIPGTVGVWRILRSEVK